MPAPHRTWLPGWPVLRGVLPFRRSAVAADVLAASLIRMATPPPGVGVQVAIAQLPDMLGFTITGTRTPSPSRRPWPRSRGLISRR